MGTLNFHNLAERAQHLLDTVDLDQLDEDTIEGLMEAAAGVLPPGVPARPLLPGRRRSRLPPRPLAPLNLPSMPLPATSPATPLSPRKK